MIRFPLRQASPNLQGGMRGAAAKAARRKRGMREKGPEKAQPAPPEMGKETPKEGNAPEMMDLICQGLDDSEEKSMGMKIGDAVAQAREKKNDPKKHPMPRCYGRITLTSEGSRPMPGSDPSLRASSPSWVTHPGRAWTTFTYAWW